MTREQQRMKLWCDAMLIAEKHDLSVLAPHIADAAITYFDKAFPPPEPDTRFDRLVQWIRDNSHRDGGELIINAHEFDRAVRYGR